MTSESISQTVDRAAYQPPTTGNQFHVAPPHNTTPEYVRNVLKASGLEATVTPTTQIEDGILLTHQLAYFTWDSQTGNAQCDGSCAEDDAAPHRNYRDLSLEQQDHFVKVMMRIMNYYRGDVEFDLDELSRLGPPVATTPCN